LLILNINNKLANKQKNKNKNKHPIFQIFKLLGKLSHVINNELKTRL